MGTEWLFLAGIPISIVAFWLIGRTEIWDDFMDEDDFVLYLMGWFMRLMTAGVAGGFWIIVLPIMLLIALLWLPWAAQQQKRHIRRYGAPSDEYDWRAKIGLKRERETEY